MLRKVEKCAKRDCQKSAKEIGGKCRHHWMCDFSLVHYAFKNPTIDEAIRKNPRKLCPEFVEDPCIGHRRSPRNDV